MNSRSSRNITEAEVTAALEGASFQGWPADEDELMELIDIVIAARHFSKPQLPATPHIGAAYEPYRFLARRS